MQDILGQNGLRAGSFLVRKKDVQSQGSFKLKPGQTAPGGSWALSYVRRGGTISTMNSTSILTISTHFQLLCHPHAAVWYALLGARAYLVLIGA